MDLISISFGSCRKNKKAMYFIVAVSSGFFIVGVLLIVLTRPDHPERIYRKFLESESLQSQLLNDLGERGILQRPVSSIPHELRAGPRLVGITDEYQQLDIDWPRYGIGYTSTPMRAFLYVRYKDMGIIDFFYIGQGARMGLGYSASGPSGRFEHYRIIKKTGNWMLICDPDL